MNKITKKNLNFKQFLHEISSKTQAIYHTDNFFGHYNKLNLFENSFKVSFQHHHNTSQLLTLNLILN